MTAEQKTRAPRVFAPDDPQVMHPAAGADALEAEGAADAAVPARRSGLVGWAGGLFLLAAAGLVGLAASVSLARFVAVATRREDWIGWAATGLLAVAALSAAVILVRELVGLLRLRRLTRLKADVQTALSTRDQALERSAVRRLRALYRGRRDLAWALARLSDHERDVRDAGDLFILADRELLAPLDAAARRAVLRSAKRVSVVTAMSPVAWLAVLFVVAENLGLLRTLAGLYGGRPGGLGALRLGHMVVGHILATGGLAMTDDLLGQFLGQDLLRRLSRRLGEGAFNGALTARIGTAAIEVTRPLPFLAASPIRLRDLVGELFRRSPPQGEKTGS